MTSATREEHALIEAARAARHGAHAPYSRFAVGTALRLSDGTIITGSNLENASYGLSLCAETVALAAAHAQGRTPDIVAIALVGAPIDGPIEGMATPCGRCRQMLVEAQDQAGRPIAILCASTEGDAVARHDLASLLPHAFGPATLR